MKRKLFNIFGIQAVFLTVGMVLIALAYFDIWHLLCPMKYLFHLQCPLCGGTRAVGWLLQGNIKESLSAHPLVLPFGLWLGGKDIVALVRYKKGLDPWPYGKIDLICWISLLILWFVLRNFVL